MEKLGGRERKRKQTNNMQKAHTPENGEDYPILTGTLSVYCPTVLEKPEYHKSLFK